MGSLSGYKIIEFAGIGPVPMCAMLLADIEYMLLYWRSESRSRVRISPASLFSPPILAHFGESQEILAPARDS
jgi:hypothetical protein